MEKYLENPNPAFLHMSVCTLLPENGHFYGNRVIFGSLFRKVTNPCKMKSKGPYNQMKSYVGALGLVLLPDV
jgi:hypothetical protein